MDKLRSEKKDSVRLSLVGTFTVFAWTWAVSWEATFPGSGPFPPPHTLVVAGSLVWMVTLGMAQRDARPHNPMTAAVGLLIVSGVIAGLLTRYSAVAGPGFLTVQTALFSLAVGLLAVITLVFHSRRLSETSHTGLLASSLLGGGVLFWISILTMDFTGWPNLWRGPEFLLVSAGALALPLVFVIRAAPFRWSVTATAGAYLFLFVLSDVFLYSLPVSWFQEPHSANGFVLLAGPLALLLPAIALDWLGSRSWPGNALVADTLCAVAIALAFIGSLGIAHWFLAEVFVPADGVGRRMADLWWPNQVSSGDWRHRYWTLLPGNRRLVFGIAGATVVAALSARLGLWLGNWVHNGARHTREEHSDNG